MHMSAGQWEGNTVTSQQSMLPIISQDTWQTVVGGEHLKNMTKWMILICVCGTQAVVQLHATNAVSVKAQCAGAAPALLQTLRLYALLAHLVWNGRYSILSSDVQYNRTWAWHYISFNFLSLSCSFLPGDIDAVGPEQQRAHHWCLQAWRELHILPETHQWNEHSQRLSSLLPPRQAGRQKLVSERWHHIH